jgi:hypothetical protein
MKTQSNLSLSREDTAALVAVACGEPTEAEAALCRSLARRVGVDEPTLRQAATALLLLSVNDVVLTYSRKAVTAIAADVAQETRSLVIEQLSRFDPSKGSLAGFVHSVCRQARSTVEASGLYTISLPRDAARSGNSFSLVGADPDASLQVTRNAQSADALMRAESLMSNDDGEMVSDVASLEDDIADVVAARVDAARDVRALWAALTDHQRAVLAVKYLGRDVLSDLATAEVLGVSRQAVARVVASIRAIAAEIVGDEKNLKKCEEIPSTVGVIPASTSEGHFTPRKSCDVKASRTHVIGAPLAETVDIATPASRSHLGGTRRRTETHHADGAGSCLDQLQPSKTVRSS